MTDIKMKISIKPEIVYVLTAIKRDADGNEVSRRASDEQHNVFTNYGVEAIYGATSDDSPSVLAGVVGTGSTTPAVGDTLLAAFLAGRYTTAGKGAHSWVDNGDGTGYVQSIWNTIFPAGVATGNISEVGSAFRQTNPTNSTPLCSRALVLDGGGSPTTFEVLADEELQLTQYFRRHISYSDQSVVLTENGNAHTVTWRPYSLGALDYGWEFPQSFALDGGRSFVGYSTGGNPVATLGPITTNSSLSVTGGTGNGQDNTFQGAQGGMNAYTPGSKKRQLWMRLGTGSLRLVSWGSFIVSGIGSWQYKIDPYVNKGALYRYTMTFEFEIDNTP